MIDTAIFVLSLTGFIFLLKAKDMRRRHGLGRQLSPVTRRVLRRCGFVALALAFIVSGAKLGWGYGIIVWTGWLTISAVLVILANADREYSARRVGE